MGIITSEYLWEPMAVSLKSSEIEGANRAEATALLIRAGYRVYRPEADVSGEDLVVRTPQGELRAVQMKGRPTVDWRRYGGLNVWMLFPDPGACQPGRPWFLVPHDDLFAWMEERHGAAPGWNSAWSDPSLSVALRASLDPFILSCAKSGRTERVEEVERLTPRDTRTSRVRLPLRPFLRFMAEGPLQCGQSSLCVATRESPFQSFLIVHTAVLLRIVPSLPNLNHAALPATEQPETLGDPARRGFCRLFHGAGVTLRVFTCKVI